MGFKAKRATATDTVFVTVPIPGWLKNDLLDLCQDRGISFQKLVGFLLVNGVRDGRGLPFLHAGSSDTSYVSGVVAYLRGERVLEPCGQRSCNKRVIEVLGSSFCDECGLSV